MIELTDNAIQQILELQERDKFNYIRVGVTGGGCAGFEYIFDTSLSPNRDDTILDYGRFKILVDTLSSEKIEGMTLDFVQEGLNRVFKFNNPNQTAACGCGVSVSF